MLAVHDRVGQARRRRVQDEVERDFGEGGVEAARAQRLGLADPPHRGDQPVAGGEREVVVQVGIVVDVDLRRELAIARCRDEEVDVRRPVAVPAEPVEQLLGLALRRAAIARGQDRAEAVAALGVGLDAAAQVVLGLRRIEEGIAALGVGMPDVDDGAGKTRPCRGCRAATSAERRG